MSAATNKIMVEHGCFECTVTLVVHGERQKSRFSKTYSFVANSVRLGGVCYRCQSSRHLSEDSDTSRSCCMDTTIEVFGDDTRQVTLRVRRLGRTVSYK
jgi:hypothetical protein